MRMDNKRNHHKMDAIGLISILKKKLFICLFYKRTGLFTRKVYCCWACPIQHCMTGAFGFAYCEPQMEDSVLIPTLPIGPKHTRIITLPPYR